MSSLENKQRPLQSKIPLVRFWWSRNLFVSLHRGKKTDEKTDDILAADEDGDGDNIYHLPLITDHFICPADD